MTGDAQSADFGLIPDQPWRTRLTVAPDGKSAALYADAAVGPPHQIATIGVGWRKIGGVVEADWNARADARQKPPGRMPSPGHSVLMHPMLGRELWVAMQAASCAQEAEETARLWDAATPGWRQALWFEAMEFRAGRTGKIGHPSASEPQLLLELLRLRGENGVRDVAREARILEPRKAALAAIKAARWKCQVWRAAQPKACWTRTPSNNRKGSEKR